LDNIATTAHDALRKEDASVFFLAAILAGRAERNWVQRLHFAATSGIELD
jgi:hypothetical protein